MSNAKQPRSCAAKHPTAAATAWRCTECARSLTGLPSLLKRRGLCLHLGNQSRLVECNTCTGKVSLKVYECPKRGEATLSRKIKGVAAVCDSCSHWSPATAEASAAAEASTSTAKRDTFSLISPLGTGLAVGGNGRIKPWQYPCTAIIPHLNTPELLPVLIDLLRLQSQPPYIIVVDTGSPFAVCDKIEQLRSDDLEIHYIRSNGYAHTSEPVTVALDVGMARANTPLIFLTHTDCFPMRPDALEWLGSQCDELTPVVGWEMSERSWITDDWQGMVSHTFTMLHASTMRRIGATWHMARARQQLGLDAGYQADGWPDTETGFSYCLRAAEIRVKLLGKEVNYARQTTEWWDHARSFTGTQVYSATTAQGEKTAAYTSDAVGDAMARAAAWRSVAGGAVKLGRAVGERSALC